MIEVIFLKVLTLISVNIYQKNVCFCKFYYFLDKNFNYGPYLCDFCYNMSLKAINIKKLAIVYCGEQAYRINFESMSKNDAFNLIKNSVIINKRGTL